MKNHLQEFYITISIKSNSYMYYHEQRYDKLLKQLPSLSKEAIGRVIAMEWRDLAQSDKFYYDQIKEIADDEYRKSLRPTKSNLPQKIDSEDEEETSSEEDEKGKKDEDESTEQMVKKPSNKRQRGRPPKNSARQRRKRSKEIYRQKQYEKEANLVEREKQIDHIAEREKEKVTVDEQPIKKKTSSTIQQLAQASLQKLRDMEERAKRLSERSKPVKQEQEVIQYRPRSKEKKRGNKQIRFRNQRKSQTRSRKSVSNDHHLKEEQMTTKQDFKKEDSLKEPNESDSFMSDTSSIIEVQKPQQKSRSISKNKAQRSSQFKIETQKDLEDQYQYVEAKSMYVDQIQKSSKKKSEPQNSRINIPDQPSNSKIQKSGSISPFKNNAQIIDKGGKQQTQLNFIVDYCTSDLSFRDSYKQAAEAIISKYPKSIVEPHPRGGIKLIDYLIGQTKCYDIYFVDDSGTQNLVWCKGNGDGFVFSKNKDQLLQRIHQQIERTA